jgi:hypothetical protein
MSVQKGILGPVRNTLRVNLQWTLCLWAAVFVVASCRHQQAPTEAQIATEAAYGASLLRCVEESNTLAESKACRAKVDAAWGISTAFRRDAGL